MKKRQQLKKLYIFSNIKCLQYVKQVETTWIHNTWNTWVIFKNTDGVLAGVNLPIGITCSDFCFYPLPEGTTYYCTVWLHTSPLVSLYFLTWGKHSPQQLIFFFFFFKQIKMLMADFFPIDCLSVFVFS